MTAAAYGGVIAGAARLRFNRTTITSGGDGVMIHTVGRDSQEVAVLRIAGGSIASKAAAVLVKTSNADIVLDAVKVTAGDGYLVHGIVDADPMAVKVGGAAVPGTRVLLIGAAYAGDVAQDDPDHAMSLSLSGASLHGAVNGATLSLDAASRWFATRDSRVTLAAGVDPASIDAARGVTITAVAPDGMAAGRRTLKGGGTLLLVSH